MRTKEACWSGLKKILDIGNVSLIVMILIGLGGVVLHLLLFKGNDNCKSSAFHQVTCYLISFALFGFAGGFTNWLAILMLFRRIPFLYGSG